MESLLELSAETYIGNPPNLGVVAHELTHLLFGVGFDMYFKVDWVMPYAAGYYSLMDGTYRTTHIDPFGKPKYGWLRPQLDGLRRSLLPSINRGRTVRMDTHGSYA